MAAEGSIGFHLLVRQYIHTSLVGKGSMVTMVRIVKNLLPFTYRNMQVPVGSHKPGRLIRLKQSLFHHLTHSYILVIMFPYVICITKTDSHSL